MSTDIGAILNNLTSCYRFAGKSVIHVGAGGGQLIGYATNVRRVVAIDPDLTAVARLRAAIASMEWENRFTVVHGEFGPQLSPVDVVFFEFCLHEMRDPQLALKIAKSLAPDVLIIDHHPESQWAWHTAETEKAARSWAVAEQSLLRLDRQFVAVQRFVNGQELLQKVNTLGEPAISRAHQLFSQAPIQIEMMYRIALL